MLGGSFYETMETDHATGIASTLRQHFVGRIDVLKVSLDKPTLLQYVKHQLNTFFPDGQSLDSLRPSHLDTTLDRIEHCFIAIKNKYFRENGQVIFNHLHSDQYAMFLYLLSNTLHKDGADRNVCDKLFYLNRLLHGINVLYAVELPDIFFFTHPVGTVLGRAVYSDFLFVYQNCTIGNNHQQYPVLGKYLTLYTGSAVLGNCHIGDNCKISAGSILIDQDLEANKIYIGTPQNHLFKDNRRYAHVWESDYLPS